MAERFCPECEMVLAEGVAKCRFCDTELSLEFWEAPPESEPPTVVQAPAPPEVEGGMFPGDTVPPRDAAPSSQLTPLPANLAPPMNLEQGGTPLPSALPDQKTPVPGDNVASRALEAELEAVISGTPIPGTLKVPPPPTGPVDVTPVDLRKLGLAAALVVTALLSYAIYAVSAGPAEHTPMRSCARECETGFKASGIEERSGDEHMDFMSTCMQKCLNPKEIKPSGEGAAQ